MVALKNKKALSTHSQWAEGLSVLMFNPAYFRKLRLLLIKAVRSAPFSIC
jgi:hypothetical protein